MEITSRPQHQQEQHQQQQEKETHFISQIPSPRPDNPPTTPPPYPTTFVQADTSTFKQVVQMLTGSTQKPLATSSDTKPGPPIRSSGVNKKQNGYKLYERRNSLKNIHGLMISPTNGILPRGQEILSPSMLNFPSLVLSPVTPLVEDLNRSSGLGMGMGTGTGIVSVEDREIAEKGYYLHPSPRVTTPGAEPRLLSLFPVTSPRGGAAERVD